MATAALALALASSCTKKKTDDSTNPSDATPAGTSAPAGDSNSNAVVAEPVAAVDKINVVASIDNLGDIFEAFKKASLSYTPDSATDPMGSLQAQLLTIGFGPGFLGNLDFDGTHVFSTAFPAQGQGGADDSDFSGSIAVKDGRKMLESTPSAYRPQPLGEGMWELTQDSIRMLIKEAGKELHLGMKVEDLDRAAGLRGEAGSGRRIRVRATNIPVDGIDPAELLDLPDIKIVRDFTKVLQELDAVELQTQIGTTSNFEFVTSATAPFHKLGLDPLGRPRTSATAVEKVLPAGPVFVASLAYGDPKMLHKMIDATVPMGMVPEPFKDMATKTVASVHGLLDQVANDVVFALYVDSRGQGTIVIASDVKDDAGTRKALRSLSEVTLSAVEMQKAMAGKDADQAFSATFKQESVKVAGKIKGDKLSIAIPKGFRDDVRDVQMFVKKNAFETTTLVKNGIAVVAIGAGGRDVVAKVSSGLEKAPKSSLGQDEGLALVRSAMGGCQVCIAGGPSEYMRFRLLLAKGATTDKAAAKAASGELKSLASLGAMGLIGAGIKLEKDAASVGAVIPQRLLYADPKKVEKFFSIHEFVSEGMTGKSER